MGRVIGVNVYVGRKVGVGVVVGIDVGAGSVAVASTVTFGDGDGTGSDGWEMSGIGTATVGVDRPVHPAADKKTASSRYNFSLVITIPR